MPGYLGKRENELVFHQLRNTHLPFREHSVNLILGLRDNARIRAQLQVHIHIDIN